MPKSRSGYKRPYNYQAPEGEKIVVSEATYQKLKTAARANRCTIGQWGETVLLNYLRMGMNVPMPAVTKQSAVPASKKERSFSINESTLDAIDRFAATQGGRSARQWIAATILYSLNIEMERLRGLQIEQDWTAKYSV